MLAHEEVAGIDVGMDRLAVDATGAAHLGVDNDAAGLRRLIGWLRRLGVKRVGLEASGGYERLAARTLSQAGFAVVLCDPGQVRAFARAMKIKAKTDPIDAAVIRRYLIAAGPLPLYQPDPIRDRLEELTAMRRYLLGERSVYAAKLTQLEEPLLLRMVRQHLLGLKAQLALIEAQIRRLIAAQPILSQRAEQLEAIPGVGPVLSSTLIAELPELGHGSTRQLASLVGVAPHPRQSGKSDRGGRCLGGRMRVRNVPYMATLSALKARHDRLYPFYKRLRDAGKPFKLAMVAAMRKLLTILNAVVRDNAQYRPA